MFLVDWTAANLMVFFTFVVIFGVAAVILFITLTGKGNKGDSEQAA